MRVQLSHFRRMVAGQHLGRPRVAVEDHASDKAMADRVQVGAHPLGVGSLESLPLVAEQRGNGRVGLESNRRRNTSPTMEWNGSTRSPPLFLGL